MKSGYAICIACLALTFSYILSGTRALAESSGARAVAITFDDLPGAGLAAQDPVGTLKEISSFLAAKRIPAAGFVIGKEAVASVRAGRALQEWAERQALLPLRQRYGPWAKIFRFPMLNQGQSLEKVHAFERFLKQSDTGLGYVSIDTSDWAFSDVYDEAVTSGTSKTKLKALQALFLSI